ncbi:MAG: LysE family translocator [Bdellovibrionota bacterium]|nr:LysE family translocator [Bdellovibrionota bacterium]
MLLYLGQLLLIHLAAVASPGPDNLLVLSYSHGDWKNSLKMASGLTLGIFIHSFLVIAGVGSYFSNHPILFRSLQFLGAAYLVYIGYSAIKASFQKLDNSFEEKKSNRLFLKALITFLSNPKAFLYFFSILPAFLKQDSGLLDYVMVILVICGVSFLWFFGLGMLVGVSKKITAIQKHPWYLRFVGSIFILLALKVALS